jgi:hypothetical protein
MSARGRVGRDDHLGVALRVHVRESERDDVAWSSTIRMSTSTASAPVATTCGEVSIMTSPSRAAVQQNLQLWRSKRSRLHVFARVGGASNEGRDPLVSVRFC